MSDSSSADPIGSPPNLEDLASRISRLSSSHYLEFLVGVIGSLAVVGRDAYAPAGYDEHLAFLRLKACNEVLEALGGALFDAARSRVPDADKAASILANVLYRAKLGGIHVVMQREIAAKLRIQDSS